ncbi:putative bifunctional diguanylate cyclase/phosphodiesterase [Kineococcus gynurae]|uniref:Bifunctional diguanylate cyclase/phosphodiesterase n=1 Tax=Kineococcus gynurae TaxID=452979 RepID=A0ABV5LSL5_9ACTN
MSLTTNELLGASDCAATVNSLAVPVRVVDATTTADEVDALFRADPGLRCLAVRPAVGTLGLLTRDRFQTWMAGPLGYGRVLHARRSVAPIVDVDPVVVPAGTSVTAVARLVLARGGPDPQVTEVLVVDPGEAPRRVGVAEIFRSLAAQLSAKVLTDPLTGLPNRQHVLLHLQGEVARPEPGTRVVVVFVDLDGFKSFNDGYGHGVGDRVLETVGRRLREFCGPGTLPARLGGDEFAIVTRTPAADPLRGARDLADALQQCLFRTVEVGRLVLPGRASIGIAVAGDRLMEGAAPVAADDPRVVGAADLLLREADLAMYRAKSAGGSGCAIVTDAGSSAVRAPFTADRAELARAVAERQFVVHYQPIVTLPVRALASVEALVRWRHPAQGLLRPDRFLDAVADAGFSTELDRHVLGESIRQAARWRRELGPDAPPHVNVNISRPGLSDPEMVADVLRMLAEHDVPASVLRLEIPESATVEHLRSARRNLDAWRAAGVGLTLDDLGAGASTLHHLTDLALDGVKIDRRFVAGLPEDARDAAVVRALLGLAFSTRLAITAEGVETAAQLAALTTLADGRPAFVQGHLIARPGPADDLGLPWPRGVWPAPTAGCAARAPVGARPVVRTGPL